MIFLFQILIKLNKYLILTAFLITPFLDNALSSKTKALKMKSYYKSLVNEMRSSTSFESRIDELRKKILFLQNEKQELE